MTPVPERAILCRNTTFTQYFLVHDRCMDVALTTPCFPCLCSNNGAPIYAGWLEQRGVHLARIVRSWIQNDAAKALGSTGLNSQEPRGVCMAQAIDLIVIIQPTGPSFLLLQNGMLIALVIACRHKRN